MSCPPPFEIGDSNHFGGQVFGAVGQIFFCLGPFIAEMRAQALNLVEGEPLGPSSGFRGTLRQVGILFEHTAEMAGGDRDQIAGDFPCGEPAQGAARVSLQSTALQIAPSCITSTRDLLEL